MTRISSRAPALLAGAALFASSHASGEPAKTRADPAAAQALFYEARALVREGSYPLACAKFEESLRLDYGIGTEFNLADCNEKLGKIASAWSGFLDVAAAARARGQAQREKVARDRARALEGRLPKLTIDVTGPAAPGLALHRDGVAIGAASWGTPMPVDPGPHRVTASAPGRMPWEGLVNAVEGKPARVTVPALAAAPSARTAPPPPADAARTDAAEPPQEPAAFPEPIVERGSAQQTFGWLLGAAGLAGIGVGAGFGIDSLQRRERARSHCTGDLCDEQGVALRDEAIASGDVATIAGIAGGTALLGGLVLVLTSPSSTSQREPASASPSLRAFPHVAANGGGVSLEGVLP